MVSDFFHGGYPGLPVGDWVQCPDDSGATKVLSDYAAQLGQIGGVRRDVVYITPHARVARVFAAMYPDGAVYRVAPGEVIGPDPDAPDCGLMVDRARVLEVVRARVEFAHRKPLSWLTMLARPCEHRSPSQQHRVAW